MGIKLSNKSQLDLSGKLPVVKVDVQQCLSRDEKAHSVWAEYELENWVQLNPTLFDPKRQLRQSNAVS